MLARVLAMALCPSVCLSVCLSQVGVLSKRINEPRWFLAWELPFTLPTLCWKEILLSPKRVLPSATLSQTPDLEDFATAYDRQNVLWTNFDEGGDAQRVINWTVVGNLSWQYLRAPMLDQKHPQDFGQWSMPPCRPIRRKFRKFDYEMVHSEVYLNKYVVSIAPFSTSACRDCSQNIQNIT